MSENSPRMEWAYPSAEDDPWYNGFRDFVIASDGSAFANREDRSIIWSGGGTLSWTLSSETFAWTGQFNIYSPMSAKLLQIAAGSIVDWADGEIVYVDLTRLALVNTAKVLQKATALPSTDDAMALGVRIGDTLYFRTGISLGDGDTSEGIAPVPGGGGGSALEIEDEGVSVDPAVVNIDFTGNGVTATQTAAGHVEVSVPSSSADRHTAKLIVGNALAGDTLAECHFLDVGDGVQLTAAIAAAGATSPTPDVWVRPGIYDLRLGTQNGIIGIPSGVAVRGSSHGMLPSDVGVHIITNDSVDVRAFSLGDGAMLWDVYIQVPEQVAPNTTGNGVVELNGYLSECRRVYMDVGINQSNPTWLNLLAAFYATGPGKGPGAYQALLSDCYAGAWDNIPSLRDLGVPSDFACYATGGTYQGLPSDIPTVTYNRCKGYGGDFGFSAVESPVVILDCEADYSYSKAVHIDAWYCIVNRLRAYVRNSGATVYGVHIQSGDYCHVTNSRLLGDQQQGYEGIAVESDGNIVTGNRLGSPFFGSWLVPINVSGDDNIVNSNRSPMAGGPIIDTGVGNDISHNI